MQHGVAARSVRATGGNTGLFNDYAVTQLAAIRDHEIRVTKEVVVPPDNVEIMEPVPGKSLVSLQTCTLPDYSERIIVQGELVDKKT